MPRSAFSDPPYLPDLTEDEIWEMVAAFYATGGGTQYGRDAMNRQLQMGRHYGYPECCIYAFVNDTKAGVAGSDRPMDSTGTYVLCPACALLGVQRAA